MTRRKDFELTRTKQNKEQNAKGATEMWRFLFDKKIDNDNLKMENVMDTAEITRRTEELKVKYPKMFTEPGLLPGEVWVGDELIDVASLHHWHSSGLRSARFGEKVLRPCRVTCGEEGGRRRTETVELHYLPVFANLIEVLESLKKRRK